MKYFLLTSLFSLAMFLDATSGHSDFNLKTLEAAVPSSAGVGQCAKALFKEECRNAKQALAPLRKSFAKYGIESNGAKIAIIALIAYESGSFAYNINHWPGRAGQGTRNMMMFPGVHEYVKSSAPLRHKYSRIVKGLKEPFSEAKQNEIRALVLDDEHSFASAAWYLTRSSDCPRNTQRKLRANSEEAFKYYTLSCIKTGEETLPDRIAVWKTVRNAFKRNH